MTAWPEPKVGLVIHYDYLWHREWMGGAEEARKNRPAVIVVVLLQQTGSRRVSVVPITTKEPSGDGGIEVPEATRDRLGLRERCWIVITKTNEFTWPGPDLRPTRLGDPSSVALGFLPGKLVTQVLSAAVARLDADAMNRVERTA